VNASTVSWTIALFFGCSIAFAAIRRWTSDDGAGVTLLVQLGFLAIVVAALVWFVRRRGGSGSGD
jgi:hypothetical protein